MIHFMRHLTPTLEITFIFYGYSFGLLYSMMSCFSSVFLALICKCCFNFLTRDFMSSDILLSRASRAWGLILVIPSFFINFKTFPLFRIFNWLSFLFIFTILC